MKCGSCRATEAESYKRIKADDNLFDVLKNLNPDQVYNPKYSYFCEACIRLAKAKLIDKMKTISVQMPTIFTTNESSAADDSESPKDEYDLMISSKKVYSEKGTPLVIPPNQSKRPANQRSMPCPKRFKKPLAPIQLQPSPETSSRVADASPRQRASSGPSVSRNKSNVTAQPIVAEVIADWSSEQQSSESASEEGILLDIDDASSTQSSASVVESQPKTTTSNRSADSSNSLSSKDLPNKQTVTPSGSRSKSDKDLSQSKTPPRRKDETDRNVSSSSDQQPNHTVNIHIIDTVPGPSAPPAKNPRIREDNANMPRDLRQYFSTQNINVSNYSRTLAG